jgi:hypothetical protein
MGSPAELDKLNKAIDATANEFDTSFYKAAKKGGDDLKTFMQGLPDLVREALPPGALGAAFAKGQAQDVLSSLKQTVEIELGNMDADPNVLQNLRMSTSKILQKMQSEARADPYASKVFAPIFEEFVNHPPQTVDDWRKFLALINATLESTGTAAETGASSLAKVAPAGQPIPGAIDPANTSLSTLTGTLGNMVDNGLKPLNDALARMPGFFKAQFEAAGAAVEAMATASVKPFQDFYSGLKALNDALTQMPGFFKTQFGAAGSNISALNTAAATPLSNFTGVLQQLDGALTRLPGAFLTAFQQAGNNVNAMVTASAAAFATMSQRISSLMQQLQQLAQAQASIGQAGQTTYYTPYQGVYGQQTGQAAYYTPYQGVFAQHGFVGIVDKPTQFVVGESGPEYVSVIPGGGAGSIGGTMVVGLADMVASIQKTNVAMGNTSQAATNNTNAFNRVTQAISPTISSLNTATTSLGNNEIAMLHASNAADNTSAALANTTSASQSATQQILQIPAAASGTTTGLNGTTGAANGATNALGNMSNAMNQIPAQFQDIYNRMLQGVQASAFAAYAQYGNFSAGTPTGGGAAGGGGGGGAAYYGPSAFAPYAQYGNFSYGTPTSGQPGSPGVYSGGGGSPYGAFGAYAQYGNFGGGSPAAAPGAAYYGGPPAQSNQYGAFGAYSQYGNFGGGGSAGGSPQQQQAASSGHPAASQGGTQGSQGQGAYQQQSNPAAYGTAPQRGSIYQYGNFGGTSGSGANSAGLNQWYANQAATQPGLNPYLNPAYQARTQPGLNPYLYQQFASGFEGIVSKATAFVAGEAGPEHVSITPLSLRSGSSIDVGSIMEMIAELIRQLRNQSINVNVNSFLDGYTVYKNQQKFTNGRVGNYLG